MLFPCVAGHDALLAAKTVANVNAAAATLASVMDDLDGALASQSGFLVGSWICKSRSDAGFPSLLLLSSCCPS